MGEVDQRLFGLSTAAPPEKSKRVIPIENLGECSSPT